jgi:uncharacterized membrane protein YeaQ/YmgE (transglycosylase-associated protein family)
MSSSPIMTLALKYGAVVAAVVAVAGGVLGYLVAGVPGLLGALVGAGLSAVFLGLTTVSMLIAGRVTRGDSTNPLFYAIVLGVVGVKLVLFLVLALWLRGQTWMDPAAFAFTAIAAVIGSLIADAVALTRARVPYVDVTLPGEGPQKS